jgi:hypothetical protein
MPVAVTNFFPTDAASAESEWQEVVIRHIGPTDWERLKFTDELDVIGPVAQPALREWGPCFPFNGHFGLPAISLARHGCYLTGIGGDEVFQLSERNRLGAVLTGRERPGRRHLRSGALALLPSRARRHYYQRRMPELPWLKPDARNELKRRIAEDEARQPIWNAPDLLKDYWCDRRRLALTLDAGRVRCLLLDAGRAPFRRRSVPSGRGASPPPCRLADARGRHAGAVRRPTSGSSDLAGIKG